LIVAHDLDFIDGNIVKYAVRNKKGENLKEKYDKIIHYCELAKELKCG
jgi:predicted nucleic acid-binding protein